MAKLDEMIQRAKGLSDLKAGWDYYSGEPISTESIEMSILLLCKIDAFGMDKYCVFPMSKGGVCVDVYGDKNEELEIFFNPDGTVDTEFAEDIEAEFVEKTNVTECGVDFALTEFRDMFCIGGN